MKSKLLLFLFVLLPSSSAWADVKIDAVNFPDASFRNHLLNQVMYCSDGVLKDWEIANITSLSVSGLGIRNLKGIEYFTALTYLTCAENKLTSFDVSKNTALEELWCGDNQLTSLDLSKNMVLNTLNCENNQLTSLDLSKNTALTNLRCYNNPLTTLDVSKNTALTYLWCKNNQLTSLDVSKNKALTYLICSINPLTSLDLSNNTGLKWLYCDRCQLTSLDVSQFTALEILACHGNQLTSLDLSKNTMLEELKCSDNFLTTLDVSKNTNLTELSCQENQLKSLDVSKNTALEILECQNNQLTTLDLSKNTKLRWLECYQNQIKDAGMDALVESLPEVSEGYLYAIYSKEEGNVMTTTQVAAAWGKGWNVCYYDGEEWEDYTAIPINEENFPDEKFRSYLLGKDYGKDGQLMRSEIVAIKYIDVSSRHIQNLKGIEHFTALTELLCYSNSLKSLDVSKNTVLTSLICSFNELTSLDVSENRVLTRLQCRGNQLKSLDVSKNTNLTELSCQENQLKSLDVSKNTALEILECQNNQLTTLDLSKNTKLRWLECYQNQIKDAGMDALVESLPEVSEGYLYAIYSKEEGNVMTTTQVAAADDKGWYVYYHDGKAWQIYAGSEEDPDGIGNVNVNDNVNDVYDLSGRRIASPRKGVNIINGRKVLVK